MPRQARLLFPGVAMHIRHRGHNRQDCFLTDNDRLVYLALLREAAVRSGCAIHAYCLMTNHVHLLVTPSAPDACSAMMHSVAQRYARYFNAAGARTGALWEGRFRSCLVESAAYVLVCYRYIELNPVRAGMVRTPSEYRWSSFAGNAGLAADTLLTPHAEFAALRPSSYAELLSDAIAAPSLTAVREALDGGYPLASETFKAMLEARSARRLSRGKPGRPRKRGDEGKSVDVPDFLG